MIPLDFFIYHFIRCIIRTNIIEWNSRNFLNREDAQTQTENSYWQRIDQFGVPKGMRRKNSLFVEDGWRQVFDMTRELVGFNYVCIGKLSGFLWKKKKKNHVTQSHLSTSAAHGYWLSICNQSKEIPFPYAYFGHSQFHLRASPTIKMRHLLREIRNVFPIPLLNAIL